jgi:hypothetical protein
MIKSACLSTLLIACGAALAASRPAAAVELNYECSAPPLEVKFAIAGGRYSGAVNCGNLFLQTDIPTAPLVRWKQAKAGRLYTLLMLDFDGNANGSWPDQVPVGENSPVRHWIVGNLSGDLLRSTGYREDRRRSAVVPVAAHSGRLGSLRRLSVPAGQANSVRAGARSDHEFSSHGISRKIPLRQAGGVELFRRHLHLRVAVLRQGLPRQRRIRDLAPRCRQGQAASGA